MTTPQPPHHPEGTPQVPANSPQPPAFAPQQLNPEQQFPQQPAFAPQQPNPEQQFPQQANQEQAFTPSPQPRPQRPARPKTDPNGVPYGIGPFTLREVLFLGAAALVFIASLLPFIAGEYADVFGYASAWAPAPWLAIPAALVLVSAAALVAARRLLPARHFRVGSLSVDQFASASSVVTSGFYLGALFLLVGFAAFFGGGADLLVPGAGVIVGLLFSLLAVVVTTIAPVIPFFAGEFSTRRDTGAHRVARPAVAVPTRPRAERPAAPQQPSAFSAQTGLSLPPAGPGEFAAYRRGSAPATPLPDDHGAQAAQAAPAVEDAATIADAPVASVPVASVPVASEPVSSEPVPSEPVPSEPAPSEPVPSAESDDLDDHGDDHTGDVGPVSAFSHVSARAGGPAEGNTSEPSAPAPDQEPEPTAVFSTQPFWVYSPVPRPVVDEQSGATLFEIGPSAWALAIVDRVTELVIRHDDGRIGVLRDLDGITRG